MGQKGLPQMGLPPLDPHSKSKNIAMRVINKIGSKSFNKTRANASPQYPGACHSPELVDPQKRVMNLIAKATIVCTTGESPPHCLLPAWDAVLHVIGLRILWGAVLVCISRSQAHVL